MLEKPVRRSPSTPTAPTPTNEPPILKPIAEKSGEGWHVSAFSHPVVKTRFSYGLAINKRVRLNPSPIDDRYPGLFGCYGTPQEAINAAMEEIADESV